MSEQETLQAAAKLANERLERAQAEVARAWKAAADAQTALERAEEGIPNA